MLLYIQAQTVSDDYGTDWEGPVTSVNDENLEIDQLPDILSSDERAILLQQLPTIETLNEAQLVHSYTVAKLFVHSVFN